jgi:DNA topoisomerase-1
MAMRTAVHLRYVEHDRPGILRLKRGKGFVYRNPSGSLVRDAATLNRIRNLVIPPAWTDVRISPKANGHLQAVGRDARGRKQYLYHEQFREQQDASKFDGLVAFGEALPRIRRRVRRDLALRGLSRNRVLAAVVMLLDRTSIRVGNSEYTRANGSYGLTTLEDRHAKVRGEAIQLRFKGKSGVLHELDLRDRRLAKIVAACQDLPGQELFQYIGEDRRRRSVDSGMVNAYLREISGEDITAKHFRTWHGTLRAAVYLQNAGPAASATVTKRNLVAAVREVAAHLGNRPATCRKYYVHPAVMAEYERSELVDRMAAGLVPRRRELSAPESCLLAILKRGKRKQETRPPVKLAA